MDWRSESGDDTGAEDHSDASGLKTLWDAFRRPVSAIPFGIAGLVGIYLVFSAFLPGGRFVSGVFLLIVLSTAILNLLVRYVLIRRAQKAGDSADNAESQEHDSALHSILARIETGLANAGSGEGAAAARALGVEWNQLRRLFEVRKATDPLALGRAATIAEETFQSGVNALKDARDLLATTDMTERRKLQWEITELTEEIEQSGVEEKSSDLRQHRLDMRRKRLESIDELQEASERLVLQARRCEETLQRTRVDLAAMRYGGTDERIDGVVTALNDTMKQVREVREELKRYGY